MKKMLTGLALVLPLSLFAAEVRLGDNVGQVRAALGAPRGHVQIGDREQFYFDRGEVEFRAGSVTRIALVSVEEQAALDAKREADAARSLADHEVRRARLITEGEDLKQRKLADPAFLTTPVAFQVGFWQNFSHRYPDVSAADQLSVAQARLNDELEEKRALALQNERMAELEARVAQAEARASEATYGPIRAGSYYSSYDNYSYRRQFNPGRIEYHFYASPLPYATSPGLPPPRPTYLNRGSSTNSRPVDDGRRSTSAVGLSSRYPF